jgi:hypothetical protein
MAAGVAALQHRAIDAMAATLSRPQREGWLRADLDLRVFSAWFLGQTMGRVNIELGDTGVDEAAYDAIVRDVVHRTLFG